MDELSDFLDDIYDPAAIMSRVCHLPPDAQRDVEQISRLIRAAFGYGGPDLAQEGRIVRIALTGCCADRQCPEDAIEGYDLHVLVNLPECTEAAHWQFARRLIAAEIGDRHPVTLTVESGTLADGIVIYDAAIDLPLNAREMSLRP